MSKSATLGATDHLIPKTGLPRVWMNFKRHWQLHLMLILPTVYLIIFNYIPLYGLQIAFKEYSPRAGIWGSEWVGLKQFIKFFEYYQWPNLVVNTIALSMYGLIVGYPLTIFTALMIHMYSGKWLKKICQNVSYIPHFISLVVMVGMLNTLLNPVSGVLGYINRMFGNLSYTDIRGDKDAFRHLYMWSGEWQGLGWSTIMYLSALSAVPDELHEAAKIDGASRWRRLFAVDLPTILPTIAIMLIMRMGSVMSVGYQKAYLMQNDMNIDTSEIISTYVYKKGLRAGDMSFGSAIGLLNSIINTCLVFLVNWITNLLTDGEMGLF